MQHVNYYPSMLLPNIRRVHLQQTRTSCDIMKLCKKQGQSMWCITSQKVCLIASLFLLAHWAIKPIFKLIVSLLPRDAVYKQMRQQSPVYIFFFTLITTTVIKTPLIRSGSRNAVLLTSCLFCMTNQTGNDYFTIIISHATNFFLPFITMS